MNSTAPNFLGPLCLFAILAAPLTMATPIPAGTASNDLVISFDLTTDVSLLPGTNTLAEDLYGSPNGSDFLISSRVGYTERSNSTDTSTLSCNNGRGCPDLLDEALSGSFDLTSGAAALADASAIVIYDAAVTLPGALVTVSLLDRSLPLPKGDAGPDRAPEATAGTKFDSESPATIEALRSGDPFPLGHGCPSGLAGGALCVFSGPDESGPPTPVQAEGQASDADVAFQRGVELQEAGRFNEAIKAYDDAIQLGSNYLVAYNNRGAAYGALKQYDRAIPDFDRAIQLNPKYTEAYCNRGAAFGALKQYERAISDFDKAIELDPKYPRAYNNLAWLLATAEEPSIRDGHRALELALKACRLSACEAGYLLDTLAAAYARKGDFAKAIEWQDKSMAGSQRALDRDTRARLQLYREGKPWPPG